MKLSKEKMWRSAERALKRTEEYQTFKELGQEGNYEIIYILTKGKYPNTDDVCAFAGFEESAISFYPFKEDEPISLWGFNFDRDLFDYLESEYELALMSPDCHYNVWCTIEEWHKGDIESVKGMQKYLSYCKRNNITKEKLKAEVSYSGMDVMTLYDAKADHIITPKEQER